MIVVVEEMKKKKELSRIDSDIKSEESEEDVWRWTLVNKINFQTR